MMLITGLLLGVIIGVMFGMIVNPTYEQEDAPTQTEHTDAEFEAVCRNNLRLTKLNNELQIRLAEKETGLDLSMPYEGKEERKNA